MGPARALCLSLGLLVVLAGCSKAPAQTADVARSMKDLVFLTRDGCVNTETMRVNLDDALNALGLPNGYQFIDADTLKESDPRGGYGTPTVLYADRDLFGMAMPSVPHPGPT
ncbi:MAG: hypothetical protein A3H97_09475 [Acidobacteria bacterium RIFCSPLOWO2_02_FULL_65_29]|nr:MAG: hypothetical protein A3H97_09475 [Acidobacteria bacterium RIFCSPLOWO2_02_FULL_65_29]